MLPESDNWMIRFPVQVWKLDDSISCSSLEVSNSLIQKLNLPSTVVRRVDDLLMVDHSSPKWRKPKNYSRGKLDWLWLVVLIFSPSGLTPIVTGRTRSFINTCFYAIDIIDYCDINRKPCGKQYCLWDPNSYPNCHCCLPCQIECPLGNSFDQFIGTVKLGASLSDLALMKLLTFLVRSL